MRNFKKLLAVLLTLILIAGLLACGKEERPAPPVDGEEITETPPEAVGSIVLAGTSRVTLHYNGEGHVITITDVNETATLSELFDTPCAEAASQIMAKTENTLTSSFLLIKQNAGSLEPDEDFLQGVVDAVKKVVGDLPIIVSAADDQNAMCYFSPKTAEAVLAAYLGNPENTAYTVSDLEDGYYQINVTGATTFTQYSVGALYGSVEQILEPADENFYYDDPGLELNQGDFTEEPPAEG